MQPEMDRSQYQQPQYQQRLQKKAPPDHVAESPAQAPPAHAAELQPMMSAIADLRTLKQGWLDGEGEALPPQGLYWLEAKMRKHFSEGAARPHIFPTAEGGVALEWYISDSHAEEASLEIDLESHQGFWMKFDTKPSTEEDLDLRSDAGWQRLLTLVRSLNP